MPDDIRGWVAEALARRTRHPELERTLFHRLQELEQGPLEQLGELVRAVVEELRVTQARLTEQTRDLHSLRGTVAVLSERLDELATRAPAPAPATVADGYVLLLPSAEGYRLLEQSGEPPSPGDLVEHEARRFHVLSRNASPFPGDSRPSFLAL
jgi:hypothetical protein